MAPRVGRVGLRVKVARGASLSGAPVLFSLIEVFSSALDECVEVVSV